MHITRQITQQIAMELGQPTVENWSFDMQEEEFARVKKHIELRRTHDVTVLVLRGNEVATIRKLDYPAGAFRAPSGGVHPEESFLDGAGRETWEETGLRVEFERYLLRIHATFTRGQETAKWTTHVMVATPISGKLEPVERDEIESAQWVGWKELVEKVNPVLIATGLGGLAYRARLHERARELLIESERVDRKEAAH
ncbi:MAG TPA: NUDIX domain-containing protein [Vicinamibacteria bacterium]|jgi:8-oxo-dGTP pyrophosphatase MutT (NUDIX family)